MTACQPPAREKAVVADSALFLSPADLPMLVRGR
jgi:hypothetical protein